MLELHDYQKRGIDLIRRNHHEFIMAGLGLGKTAMSLKAIELIRRPAIVLAPINVAYLTWPKEIKKWTPNLSYTILHGKDKDLRLNLKRDIYILNYDGLIWFMRACIAGNFKWNKKMFLILDESTCIKDHSTMRFRILQKMKPIFSNFRVNLSATPSPEGLHNLWTQYWMLDGGKRLGPSYPRFRDNLFKYDPYTYKTFPKPGTQKVIFDLTKDITMRLDAEDYNKLPPVMYNAIRLQMPPKIRKIYDEMEKKFCYRFDEDIVSARSSTTLSMKLRQFMQGAMYIDGGNGRFKVIHDIKLQALKDLVDDNPGKNIMCPIQFNFEKVMLRKKFGNLPLMAGETTPAEASYIEDKWNLRAIPLLLCHPASVKYGLNMQTGGDILLWYALPWSLLDYQQLIGRLVRQGMKRPLMINHLIFEGTIDEGMMVSLGKKDASQRSFLNDMRQYLIQKWL